MTLAISRNWIVPKIKLKLFLFSENDERMYDVAIIGGGLFGSATAKYVSEDVKNAILIGPSG